MGGCANPLPWGAFDQRNEAGQAVKMNPLHITQRAAAGTLERLGYSAVAPTLRRSAPIAALLFLSPATVVAAQERGAKDQINVGIAKSASPQVRRNAEAEKALRVEPTRTFEYADQWHCNA